MKKQITKRIMLGPITTSLLVTGCGKKIVAISVVRKNPVPQKKFLGKR